MTADIRIENLSLRLGGFRLRGLSLSLGAGEILALLGPNGAGKSVSLETIAGFHRLESGRIFIRGRDATNLPPERRKIGLIFQNYSLFPHLSVARNILFGFDARRAARRAAETPLSRLDLAGLLDYFGIAHLADRAPQDLSPGESQRVALARTFASAPDLFLFDEPFSALDAQTRTALRRDLDRFLREARIPAIFVTHNHEDVRMLGDRIAVMRAGEIVQSGTAREVFHAPSDPFVAAFVGIENILPGRVLGEAGGLCIVEIAGISIRAAAPGRTRGSAVHVCIRSEDIELCAPSSTGRAEGETNRLQARVAAVVEQGLLYKVTLDCGFLLDAYLTAREMRKMSLTLDARLELEFAPGAAHLVG